MRCEGWRRYGGAFTLGPVKWEQCKEDAIVMLKVKQEKTEELPACLHCWNEGKEKGITILSAEPIPEDRRDDGFERTTEEST